MSMQHQHWLICVVCLTEQVKALEAAEAARRKEAAKAADRLKQKGTLDKQRAERVKVYL